ncbi:bifunctional homocysteine S-methyltransferase/methylenetetrahydrofolate reductase [Alicyclobacillus sp. ALC3]|uniref:bifunctional homocysteine S-methyltransferase/methylenetetrahydrofolate reductase n=1 Tax=Alicyclobacillus sp. ALC3 TaxID=2796143 RepID=UPI0023784AB2|nr:bifunctional homocysteine S-methyltransferase/methylenetetrahydrofolate reductase [Alicyclobacillus sp. ALC3]WDL97287.1 bifunctional homocysteine S-methyltransferase/methylenetetrahydrofolate reductase [Alicyclobacillus sp. ALC3]
MRHDGDQSESPITRDTLLAETWVGDGAMATLLHQWGVPIRTCYEALSVSMPEWVANVHKAYLNAGANFIQTNTFGAHKSGLARYHAEREVASINTAAVHVARLAVQEFLDQPHPERLGANRRRPLVFGTIGSIGGARAAGFGALDPDVQKEIGGEYDEQASALLAAGVDGIVLETFAEATEMVYALEVVRSLTDLPVLANLSPETIGVTVDGVPVAEAFEAMRSAGATVVGLNCRLGPSGILRTYEQITLHPGVAYAAVPNAGILQREDNDLRYTGSAEYFADIAERLWRQGVRWLGGCCGTTPTHIEQLALRVANVEAGAQTPILSQAEAKPRIEVRAAHVETPVSGAATIVAQAATKTTVIVELDPPRTVQSKRFLAGARALRDAGADFITMADNSLGHVRVSNMALAALLKQEGIEPLVHVTCRDRNLIGQQSHLMGLEVLGVRHILLVTGDPTRFGDLPGATSVYDVSSTELTRLVKRLNAGIAFSGQPMRQPSRFVVGTSFNPYVANFDRALERLKRKVDAGADYVMTQPVFEPQRVEQLARATDGLGVPVFIGVMPLVSHRNAQFLHNEVPGIAIPEDVLARMASAPEETATEMGLKVAEEILDVATECFRGIYLITPFLRYELTESLTAYVKAKTF